MTRKLSVAPFACALCLVAFTTTAQAATTVTDLEGIAAQVILDKHGADDPAGDSRRGRGADDGAGHASIFAPAAATVVAKNGADDPAGHNRRGRGADDGAGHASILVPDASIVLAKNGADDPAGDNRRGRGADDGAGHA